MRIARLDLLAYGHFEDCHLDFPHAPVDMHLVLGANEAGKSTTLAAVTDLLFGFPKTTPYAFRHDNELLRIGAVLGEGSQAAELHRRKGNKNTLLDAAGSALPDAMLTPLLHGLTRETFHRGFALDHQRLRAGGHAMLDADGDVGQALAAAGSGLTGVQRVLDALKDECDAIWGERRSAKRSYTRMEDELKAATQRLRDAEVRPKDWADAVQTHDAQQAEQQALAAKLAGMKREHRRVQRIRRLAGPVRRREQLHAAIRDSPPSPFDQASEAVFAAAIETLRAGQAAVDAAAAEAEALLASQSEHLDDPIALDHEPAIAALTEAAAVARKAAADMVARRSELASLTGAVDRLVAELGWAAAPVPALQAMLPARPLLASLDALAQRAADAAVRQAKASAGLRTATWRVTEAEAALARLPPSADAEVLQRALRLAQQQALPRHENLAVSRRGQAKAKAARDTALKRLLPWDGEAAGLAGLVVPAAAEIDAAAGAIDRARQETADADRDAAGAAEALARLQLEAGQLAATGGAVPLAGLLAARAARDAGWAAIHAHVRGEQTLPDPDAAATALSTAVAHADTMADKRFAQAEASARLVALEHEQAHQALRRTQAVSRRATAAAAAEAAEADWARRLAAAGLPLLAPARLRQWGAEQAAALAAAGALAEAEAVLAMDAATVKAASAALQSALGAAPEAHFPELLAAAEAEDARQTQAAATRLKLETQFQSARDAVREAAQEQEAMTAEAAGCNEAWRAATAGTPLDGTAAADAAARLALVRELREALGRAAERAQQVGEIEADLAKFDHDARTLAEVCGQTLLNASGQDVAHALGVRLEGARDAAQARRTLQQRVAREDERRAAAQGQVTAAWMQISPLTAQAGSGDLVALGTSLERFALRRANEAAIREADAAILADGNDLDLATLLDEVATADLEGLVAQDAELGREIAVLQEQMVAQAHKLGSTKAKLDALKRGTDAAIAAADVAQAQAALSAEADAYVERKAQAVLLSWAIEQYREQHQNPILARAAVLFRTLTLGRYTELRLGLDNETPRLIALRAIDGRTVAVSGMSEGTADQLFLALRLAALEQSLASGVVVPFLADDLFINFDDRRAEAGFRVLGEVARKTQVLFFTHHDHLPAIAQRALHPHAVMACALA